MVGREGGGRVTGAKRKKEEGHGERAERALRWVREASLMAFDTETSGVDWKRNFPVGYVFATNDESIWVPVRCGGGGNLPGVAVPKTPTDSIKIHPFERDLKKAFIVRKGKTVGHHIKFDAHMVANAGIMLGRNLSCTQNLEALLDEYVRSYSLESCAERHKVAAKKSEALYQHLAATFGCPTDKKSMSHFWKLAGNDPQAVIYAEGDGTTTLQLYQAQMKEVGAQDLTAITKLEDDLIWTLFRIERRGIKVDVEYLNELQALITKRVDEAYELLPKDFNVRSPLQVQAYVEAGGKTDWPITEHGNPSFTEQWLRTFPRGQHIVTVRKMTNLINTFVVPLRDVHVHEGRVHPTLNQLKADDYGTPARLSCSNPNLQQIPKRDKELARLFRKAFIADEGMEFYEADYSQCEPRLYAHYSQDQRLLDGYSQTPFKDVHTIVAELLKVERDPTAKRMNMGIFTGMYPKSFAEHMMWPIEKATDLWQQWHAMFPKVREFQDLAKNVLLQRGYVKTILGRRLRLEHPRFAYRAVSKIIQGSNADIMKYKLLELDKILEIEGNAQLLMSVHDSLEWQAPKGKAGYAMSEKIMHHMTDVQGPPFNLRVPFAVDYNRGKNWSAATFGGDE